MVISIHNTYSCTCLMVLTTGNEKEKDMNWVRLGHILKKTAENHKSYTTEIAALCNNMIQGTLKGYFFFLYPSAILNVLFEIMIVSYFFL